MNILDNLFHKKRNMKSGEVMVNDFQRRTPYWSYRPANYRIYEPFMEYKKEIDKYLEKLFSGEIDDGNGDVLDNMIAQMTRQAERVLDEQRTEHKDMLKSFDIRRLSDRETFENQLKLLRDSLEKNKSDQEEYRNRMRGNEFTKGGN